MTTLTSEIDEALTHLSQVPPADRGQAWHAYLDALLEQRLHWQPEGGNHGDIQPQTGTHAEPHD
jgi:hypothetical protein